MTSHPENLPRFHFDPPQRILLGPGPGNVSPRVLAALGRPTVGYMDPTYLALMEQVQRQLQALFRTRSAATFAVTGSGTTAMECAIVNLVEAGDPAIACVHGYFGQRMREILERAGARVHVVDAPWGKPIDPEALRRAVAQHRPRVVTVVHGETSTGVLQPVEPLAEIVRGAEGLFIVDTVASLGGVDFRTDEWGIDVAYTGAQKCLGVPPGVSPITFGPRAMQRVASRTRPCASWALDVDLNLTYWNRPAAYHHTGPINLTYALYEGLCMLEEDGLETRIAHTQTTARALWAGLEALGLPLLVAPEYRLPTLTTAGVPTGIDEAAVRQRLLDQYGIEIAGGLGAFKGKAWRIGLMGASCNRRNVLLLLSALGNILARLGQSVSADASIAAAMDVWDQ